VVDRGVCRRPTVAGVTLEAGAGNGDDWSRVSSRPWGVGGGSECKRGRGEQNGDAADAGSYGSVHRLRARITI